MSYSDWVESAERAYAATRKVRHCNCVKSDVEWRVEWHLHGTRATCPPKPPVQEFCSPSLSAMGQCHCSRHRDEFTDA